MTIIDLINEIADRGSFSFTKDTDPIKREVMNKLEAYGLVILVGKNKYRLSQDGYLAHQEGGISLLEQTEPSKRDLEASSQRKIFISHSSLDLKIVEQVIEILEGIGAPTDRIFCTSFEGYSIGLGQDFLETIKTELDNEALVLFILTSNFYDSPVSLCEMGATWVKTNEHIPILIPPFDFSDIKGVIPNTQGMKINDKAKLNSLKEKIETFLSLTPKNFSAWERKRDNLVETINSILDKKKESGTTISNNKTSTNNTKRNLSEQDILIKQRSKQE